LATLADDLPTLRAFTRPLAEMEAMGRQLIPALTVALGPAFRVSLEDATSQIGSGALPTEEIPTKAIAIEHDGMGATQDAERFRRAIDRIEDWLRRVVRENDQRTGHATSIGRMSSSGVRGSLDRPESFTRVSL
jgi:L-seryl-tRNA(Ser) seleniumtransferase